MKALLTIKERVHMKYIPITDSVNEDFFDQYNPIHVENNTSIINITIKLKLFLTSITEYMWSTTRAQTTKKKKKYTTKHQ